ncbi:MAG: TetR/AcrR family transcriptional regulator [Oscillospiraceae bacterium]|nr:TetR/AcrR family transcriptional regulator [Oscillospiraceae bacterium]
MPKTDLRVVKTRANIRNVLVGIMSEKPISRITVSEVCEQARINRKTFYRHYHTVGEVLEELENEFLGEFSGHLQSGSLLNIGAVVRGVSETVKLHRDFFARLMRFNPEIFTGGKMKLALRRTISAALRNNGSEFNAAELNAVSEFIVSGVLSVYASWFNDGCREDIDVLADISVKTAVKGLSAFVPEKKLLAE